MNQLSDRARSLLERAGGAGGASAADFTRVKAGVLAAVAPAAAAGATAATLGGLKMVLVFAAAATVGSGVVLGGNAALKQPAAPPQQPAVVVVVAKPQPAPTAPIVTDTLELAPEPAKVRPAPKPAAQPAPAPVHEAAPLPTPAVAPPPTPAVAPPPPPTGCTAERELSALQRAQQQLETAPAEALSTLNAYESQCAGGDLLPERTATRALALCTLGRLDDAESHVRWLEQHQPASPAMGRVRRLCKDK